MFVFPTLVISSLRILRCSWPKTTFVEHLESCQCTPGSRSSRTFKSPPKGLEGKLLDYLNWLHWTHCSRALLWAPTSHLGSSSLEGWAHSTLSFFGSLPKAHGLKWEMERSCQQKSKALTNLNYVRKDLTLCPGGSKSSFSSFSDFEILSLILFQTQISAANSKETRESLPNGHLSHYCCVFRSCPLQHKLKSLFDKAFFFFFFPKV